MSFPRRLRAMDRIAPCSPGGFVFAAALIAGALMLAPAVQAAGAVSVVFVHPERFNDDEFRYRFTPAERAAVVAELTRHIQRAAQSLLPPGRTLQVEILDLQRAGRYDPLKGTAAQVRILTSVDPPRIVLRYKLGGTGTARSGNATLTDPGYLANAYARSSGDHFIYEKALLDDWLRKIATR